MNSIFWPYRKQHKLRAVELAEPRFLTPTLRASLKGILPLANAIRDLERAGEGDSELSRRMKALIRNHLTTASAELTDKASRQGLDLIAKGLINDDQYKSNGSILASLDEQELVGHVGPLGTWLGKSRKLFFSAFFGTPNNSLQAVSDVVDKYFEGAVSRLSASLGIELKTTPGCAYKIIDLFGIAGEADTFPKHFAYFMPEDQGVKYAENKRTVVFANTYLVLYQQIAHEQKVIFGWTDIDLPCRSEIGRYLIGWFRGHDLGHSIVTEATDYRLLSRHDRWGSMVVQEAVADVFGFLLILDPEIAECLELDISKMIRLYVLELLRYLRRGPADFPDAGSAYIQLRLLEEWDVLSVNSPGSIDIDCARFVSAMARIAELLVKTVLVSDVGSFDAFLNSYSPHLADTDQDLLFGLEICDTSLFYEQTLTEKT